MMLLKGVVVASVLSAASVSSPPIGTTFKFESETEELMNILVDSLYTDKDIFLRELVSNSNDAIERYRLSKLGDETVKSDGSSELGGSIKVLIDDMNDRILVVDNGIGMCRSDLIERLGKIASSSNARNVGRRGDVIGKFGVGFYSVFLVADHVIVHSKCEQDADTYEWASLDRTSYTVRKSVGSMKAIEGHGTVVELRLKKDLRQRYLDKEELKKIILEYDTFMKYPIYIGSIGRDSGGGRGGDSALPSDDVDDSQLEQLQLEQPIWLRKDLTHDDHEEEYSKFFRVHWNKNKDPVDHIHFTAQSGDSDFIGLLYIPPRGKEDVFNDINKVDQSNFQLYIKRVLVANNLDKFVPPYLNFLYGIIDADNLPLKVDRQSLTDTRIVRQMQRKVLMKTFEMLRTLARKNPRKYMLDFWKGYDQNMALGCTHETDMKVKERILSLYRFRSINVKHIIKLDGDTTETVDDETEEGRRVMGWTTLDDYIKSMKSHQKVVYYYHIGDRHDDLNAPVLEFYIKNRVPVLLLSNTFDEGCLVQSDVYKNVKLQSIEREQLSIESLVRLQHDDGSEQDILAHVKRAEYDLERMTDLYQPLIKRVREALGYFIDVKVSYRLIQAPILVSVPSHGFTPNYEKMIKSQIGGADQHLQKILSQIKTVEINPYHPIIKTLLQRAKDHGTGGHHGDHSDVDETINVLYQSGLLNAGFDLTNLPLLRKHINTALLTYLEVSDPNDYDSMLDERDPDTTVNDEL